MAKTRQDGSDGGAGQGEGGGGFRGRRVTTCSFCGKTSRDVGPMVEGPNEVYICSHCVDLCGNIFRQEKRKVGSVSTVLTDIPTPRHINEHLDQYVIGQKQAKRADLLRAMQILKHQITLTITPMIGSHIKRKFHADIRAALNSGIICNNGSQMSAPGS